MAFSQDKKYDALWKRVDSLSAGKGLTSSALKEVEKIYQLAKKENNDAQLIKALIYQVRFQESLVEDAQVKSIKLLEAEIKTAKEPAASILNSIVAEMYWVYFQQHRWQFYGRTETAAPGDEVETWSIARFHKTITDRYLASLTNEVLLQQVNLERFEPLIIKGNTRTLRPTLFDLLAHRAIRYFRNEERDVIRPAYAFFINDPMAFAPAATFINYTFRTSDSLSLQHKALQIYQRILKFHQKDNNPAAFIDADLQRIQFVTQFGQMENKDSLYLEALESVTRNYPDYRTAAPAYYLVAQWHADKASQYNARTDTSYRYNYIKAKAIAEKILEVNKENESASNSQLLLNRINAPHLDLETEKVNLPGLPFRTLVNFKNIRTLHLRIIKISDAQQQQLRERYDDSYWQRIAALPVLKSWVQPLPETNDYQLHATEIKIDPLPWGNYILITSSGETFNIRGQALAAQHFYVSNISYVNNINDYFLLHRQTGKPLANASVQVWNEVYDYASRKYNLTAAEKIQADQHGFFRLKERVRGNSNIKLEITHNNERLFQDENHYGVFRDGRTTDKAPDAAAFEKANARIFFFTDRSIYRPGQQVHFKGIAVTRDFTTRKSKILSDYATVVKLYNVNGELVDSLKLTTNAFGSYSGNFSLPEKALNGIFRLRDDVLNSETYFSVEEYKRPAFYVSYEEIKGTYKLNDSIRVTGLAKAYAGNNIDGAGVSYTVVREARLLYPWLRGKWGFPRTTRVNIAQGTTTTDAEGKFSITFKAIPDRSIDTALQPVFDYKIIATITDLNGETRLGEKIVPVSYKALKLNVTLPEGNNIALDSLKRIEISTQNLNGQPEASLVTVQVYKLKAPDRLIRKRYWAQPDLFLMSREEYLRNFPNDEYNEESEVQNWEKANLVYTATDSSNKSTAFLFSRSAFTEGWFVAEAVTKDKYGQEVKNRLYFQLYDKQTSIGLPVYTWNAQTKISVEPGQETLVGIGSAANDLFVVQHIDRDVNRDLYMVSDENKEQPAYEFLTLNKEKKWIPFQAKETDKGGFGVFHFYVKDNRFYIISNMVSVPWSDKTLSISYETFRDKTLPGSKEQWKVKISGYKNEQVAAELLASMYDASLDQFNPHNWTQPSIWPVYQLNPRWSWINSFASVNAQQRYLENSTVKHYSKIYDQLLGIGNLRIRGFNTRAGNEMQVAEAAAPAMRRDMSKDPDGAKAILSKLESVPTTATTDVAEQTSVPVAEAVQLRKNFNETAFFLPDLKTDAQGNIEFSFTIPEALTRWKFQALSHTKDLAFALSSKEVITQKELMVQPNVPRFLREGDRMELSTKIVNLSSKEITGTVQLELLNAATMQPVDGWFQNAVPNQYFTAEAGRSAVASFRIEVPYQYNSAVVYRFIARSAASANGVASVTDGEESLLPVLTNSMLVTETMPLPVKGGEPKTFRFEKLLNAGSSETLKHHAITVEFSSNPAWYAVQALPFLATPLHQSADHLFNRYYANALAFKIANASPRIRQIFEQWKTADTAALLSNLQKNQELKSVLLEETPWVLQAKTEAEQKKNIALLFDMVKMGNELTSSIVQVKEMQSPNGGFVWFKGGPDDRYMTQYILTSIGKLKKLDALPANQKETLNSIIYAAVKYLDERIKDDHGKLTKQPKIDLNKNQLGYLQVQYLYMRSFFNEIPIPGSSFNAVNYYRKQAQQFWLQQNKYMQGMIALSLYRTGDKAKADDILKSLKENSIYHEELGRYWKANVAGYFWHQAPIETQSLLIEAFSEIQDNAVIVGEMKTWLLKQKQTQNWKTSKATADACYALLMQSTGAGKTAVISSWLDASPTVEIVLGNKTIRSSDEKQQAGTGYFKKTLEASFISPEMGNITVNVKSTGASTSDMPAWGAVYWQYFERLDRITPASTPLQIEKKLFVEKNTDRGPVLQPVTDGYLLRRGDRIKVRVVLKVDRDMEYVHLKDMRASCMEPVNVLSGYRWQGGLGYYETTRDASTSFFFHWLPKGSYVFEYPLFVTQAGNFSNGITTVESMYAPEFSSHSEGVRVNVE